MDRENNDEKKIDYDLDRQKSEQDDVDYDSETDDTDKQKRHREFRNDETRYKYLQYVYENTKKEIEDIQESSEVKATRRSLSKKKMRTK